MASPSSATSVADIDMADEGAAATAVDHATADLAEGENTCKSVDPLDPRKVAFDIFEVYCQEMLTTTAVERRASLVVHMQYMVRRLIAHQLPYGRLYNRTCIAQIVSKICGVHPYETSDEAEESDDFLVQFTPRHWEKNIARLEKLRASLIRNDASFVVMPSQLQWDDHDERARDNEYCEYDKAPAEDDTINKELVLRTDFSKGYTKVLDLMKFHTCLSHLQPQLQMAIQGTESVIIPQEDIIDFQSAIEEQYEGEEDSKYAVLLNDLLEENNEGDPKLKPFGDIKEVCTEHFRVFDLEHFQRKFLQLIRRWDKLVLPVPELSNLKYGSTNGSRDDDGKIMTPSAREKEHNSSPGATPRSRKQRRKRQSHREERKSPLGADATLSENEAENDPIDSASEDEIEEEICAREVLKSKRKALMKKVNDPFDESLAVAKSARVRQEVNESENEDGSSKDGDRGVKTPTFRKKKKSAHHLEFTDSDNSDEEATVPARRKSPKRKAPREIQVSRKRSRVRIPFTDEESAAIINGVDKFGKGKWELIKSDNRLVLENRTAVQIKDRWRTLEKLCQK